MNKHLNKHDLNDRETCTERVDPGDNCIEMSLSLTFLFLNEKTSGLFKYILPVHVSLIEQAKARVGVSRHYILFSIDRRIVKILTKKYRRQHPMAKNLVEKVIPIYLVKSNS